MSSSSRQIGQEGDIFKMHFIQNECEQGVVTHNTHFMFSKQIGHSISIKKNKK
jgi:hypothetical protein